MNYINKLYASCQVIKDPNDFEEMIGLCNASLKYFLIPKGQAGLVIR